MEFSKPTAENIINYTKLSSLISLMKQTFVLYCSVLTDVSGIRRHWQRHRDIDTLSSSGSSCHGYHYAVWCWSTFCVWNLFCYPVFKHSVLSHFLSLFSPFVQTVFPLCVNTEWHTLCPTGAIVSRKKLFLQKKASTYICHPCSARNHSVRHVCGILFIYLFIKSFSRLVMWRAEEVDGQWRYSL